MVLIKIVMMIISTKNTNLDAKFKDAVFYYLLK